jgi:competence ComEA-like helix-hairpin-helix protein
MKRIVFLTVLILSAGLVHAADPQMGSTSKAGVINVNTASEDQLKMLPLIDEQLARNIIEYRNASGPFKSVEDLQNVKGMSKAKYDQIRQYLVVSGDTTFNPSLYKQNSSSGMMHPRSSPRTNPSY